MPAETLLGHENWEHDGSVSHCRTCSSEFGMFKRRHHCRACGLIFCDHCTGNRIAVHRSHYAESEEKKKRVCAQCYASRSETQKFLESVKEQARTSRGLPYLLPDPQSVQSPEELENSVLYMSCLESSGVFQARASARPMLGLPRVAVTGVDHHNEDEAGGKEFFFEPTAWPALIGGSQSGKCIGKTLHVVQFREGKRVWAGAVTVNRSWACCFGRRSSGEEYGQWQVGDTIANGCNSSRRVWKLEDSIPIGTDTSMFDYTVPRLDENEYSSVTQALESLNADASRCEEGICIVHSSSQSQYFLLVRRDQQNGLRLCEGSRNGNATSKPN